MRVNANLSISNIRPNAHIIMHLFLNLFSSYIVPPACEGLTQFTEVQNEKHSPRPAYF